ncbi:MAG: rRNA maturation RNase YbeY [Gammaproteobacteria bacterium]|nr:rRNA maturation RNase YbeY [Gammaproteobacteria bacterium]|tara:strand:- start:2319 stop:2789 length:471 start_codon:yes stop_codon:yes gene_type:complete
MIKEKKNLLKIKIIRKITRGYIPTDYKISKWATLSYMRKKKSLVTIKLADKKEMMQLNQLYSNKKIACNTLSFSCDQTLGIDLHVLGDIALCPSLVNKESKIYNKTPDSRWAHMIIHSMLHLQGYKHNSVINRNKMESIEIKIMKKLGYKNPYYAN